MPAVTRLVTYADADAGRDRVVVSARQVAEGLAERGVAVAAGHYYSILPMEALGLLPDGAVRASIAHYTTSDEIDRLLVGVREIARRA